MGWLTFAQFVRDRQYEATRSKEEGKWLGYGVVFARLGPITRSLQDAPAGNGFGVLPQLEG